MAVNFLGHDGSPQHKHARVVYVQRQNTRGGKVVRDVYLDFCT